MPSPYERLRAHCLAKPGAVEEYPWGDVAWKVRGKGFAFTSPESRFITLKSTLDKQSALIQHPNITVAPYVGRHGWIQIEMVDEPAIDLALELADESYDLVTNRKR